MDIFSADKINKKWLIHPDEIVYTKRGPKKIHTITKADFVATQNGEYVPVAEVYKQKYAGKLYSIKSGSTYGRVNENHELLVAHGDHCHYCSAKHISLDMQMITVIPKTEIEISNTTSKDLMLYGIILSTGEIVDVDSQRPRVRIARTMMSKFVLDMAKNERLNEVVDDKSGEITMDLPFPKNTIFDDDGKKHFHSPFALLPKEKLTGLTSGIWMSNSSDVEGSLDLESNELAEQLRLSFYRCNIPVDVVDSKIVKVPADKGRWVDDNTYARNIDSIDVVDFKGLIYDLQTVASTESDSSYLTPIGINHNGGGKRNGSFAIYLEPWHGDIVDFLELKKPHGEEEKRARDLFYALWIPDLFMKRIEEAIMLLEKTKRGIETEKEASEVFWSLMDPNVSRGLADVWGEEFEQLYERYESEGKYIRQLPVLELWNMILTAQIETGTPYMLYKDSVNRKSNQSNLGTIKSSNLCVHPDTPILTKNGHIPIKDLHGQNVEVWNGEEFSTTTIMKTGQNQKLIEMTFSNGRTLKCTEYHKFHIVTGSRAKGTKTVTANELTVEDRLIRSNFPVIDFDDEDFPHAYTHGFFCGDGTIGNKNEIDPRPCAFRAIEGSNYCKRHAGYGVINGITQEPVRGRCRALSYNPQPQMSLYGEKQELIEHFDIRSSSMKKDSAGKITLSLPLDIPEKFVVPINKSINVRLAWLAGYCDADACVVKVGTNEAVQIASSHFEFLQNVQLMLQTVGVDGKITVMNKPRTAMLPDGHGGRKEYECATVYRLLVNNADVNHLRALGWTPNRLKFHGENKPNRDARQYVKLVKKADVPTLSDTYCFNEPKRHLGIFNGILAGNCCEICEFTSPDEVAVCNLSSVSLPAFVDREDVSYNLDRLHATVKIMTRNLNKVIDVNYYPVPEAETSNMRHRPIGIGIQGLADVLCMLKYPFESVDARKLNRDIAETMYHAALEASCELAAERESEINEYKQLARIEEKTKEIKKQINGILKRTKFSQEELTRTHCPGAYDSYFWNGGCPVSKGILQYDMWGVTPSDKWNWADLKDDIETHGIRNSLLIAPMPTASTSQILGNMESFEPYTSNIYTRRTMAGEFAVVNKHLMRDLIEMGLWNEDMKQQILAREGSIQDIDVIPRQLRAVYKTVWEVSQKTIIDMAADRGAFTCQSQSMNIYISTPRQNVLTSMHMYGWKSQLKCGSYYLRATQKASTQKFTVDPSYAINQKQQTSERGIAEEPIMSCSRDNPNCDSCGS